MSLKLLDETQLEGYVFQQPGGPKCSLVYGRIKGVRKLSDTRFDITISDGTEEITVSLTDREGDHRNMLATRFKSLPGKPNYNIGNRFSVLYMEKGSNNIGLDFRFYGCWHMKGYKGEYNIMIGFICQYTFVEQRLIIMFREGNCQRMVAFHPKVESCAIRDLRKEQGKTAICYCGPKHTINDKDVYVCQKYLVSF